VRALILDGSRQTTGSAASAAEALARLLPANEWRLETVGLRSQEIAPCRGCFGCWIRTPGECVIDDFGRQLARLYIGSHLVVMLSPVTFGGYSPELKRALDRTIGLVHGLFCEEEGMTRHPPRYPRYPRVLAVGLLGQPDQEAEVIFRRLVECNARNYRGPAWRTGLLYEGISVAGAELVLGRLLSEMGVGAAEQVGR
jgi:multimeric flavodoxin WrbA